MKKKIMRKKKECKNETAGLLPNWVTIQWKLYRDTAVLGVQLGWWRVCHDTIVCIVTGMWIGRCIVTSRQPGCGRVTIQLIVS